jgi:hypothetical protein
VAIAGRAEEHRVAEGQQAAEADQQVERAGEEREAQRLHQEHRVDHGRGNDEERHHHHEGDAVVAQLGLFAVRGVREVIVAHGYLCPNSPCGRIMRTIAMMTKITVLDASG